MSFRVVVEVIAKLCGEGHNGVTGCVAWSLVRADFVSQWCLIPERRAVLLQRQAQRRRQLQPTSRQAFLSGATMLWLAVFLAAGSWALSLPVMAAEYVGLWRVEEESPGINVSYPDNGFSGACVSLSGGTEMAGKIRLLSQINRHRFESVKVTVSGMVDPTAVHVQLSAKGKSVWGADGYSFDSLDVVVPLKGAELAIEALELAAGATPWAVTFCGLEFANEAYALRFTSDCAGLDFVSIGDSLRLVADEDWVALGREITGGMALFGLAGAWGYQESSLQVASTFPDQLFYVALAVNDEPVLQPDESMPGLLDYPGGDLRDYALVVKGKGHTVGSVNWQASVSWHVSGGSSPELSGEVRESFGDTQESGNDVVKDVPDAGGSERGSGGCSANSRAGSPGVILLLVLLVIGGYLLGPRYRGVFFRGPAETAQRRKIGRDPIVEQ
jgi:hypothetical protein